jgi:hypothetical protein
MVFESLASRIVSKDDAGPVAAGHVEGLSVVVYAKPNEQTLKRFLGALPKGHEISTRATPSGHAIDVNPRFGDQGMVGITMPEMEAAIDAAYAGVRNQVFHHDYSSVYTDAHDYEAIIDRFTASLAAEEGGDSSAPANLERGTGQVPRQGQQRTRRDDFARAQARLQAFAGELSSEWESLSATMERRLAQGLAEETETYKARVFYSGLLKAVEGMKQGESSGPEWMATIASGAKPSKITTTITG